MAAPEKKPRQRLTAGDWARLVIPVLIVVAFVGLAWKFGYFKLKDSQHLQKAAQQADSNPWLAPIFIALYALIGTFAAPVSPLAYAAGAMFGVVQGSIWVWLGSMIAAVAGYWMARGMWMDTAKRLLGRYEEKLRELKKGNAFLTVLRLQVLPIVPFGIFNYASAVTPLPFFPFLAGTALGVIPGTIAAVYVGDRIAAGLEGHELRAFLIAAAVMAALFGLSFLPKLFQKKQPA